MFIDARALPADEIIETEVCIVGSGPAAITLAKEFIGQHFKVCLLESGGLEFNEQTQSLYQGETIGVPFQPLDSCRRRQFGGTGNLWSNDIGKKQYVGFICLPLEEIDFEKRDWLPYSGWPFGRTHLDPFYERARSVCKVGPVADGVASWRNTYAAQLPLPGDRVTPALAQFSSRTFFTHQYRDEINQAGNITTYLNANVVEVETDATARTVTRLRVACLEGNEFWVRAKVFILATGGIENARLLLLSNKTQKAGLGNQHDLVGRFFMDHPLVNFGTLIPPDRHVLDSKAFQVQQVNDVPARMTLALSDAIMRHEQLMNMDTWLIPKPKFEKRKALDSLKALLVSKHRPEVSKDVLEHLGNVVTGIDYITAAAIWAVMRRLPVSSRDRWAHLPEDNQKCTMFEVYNQTEQAPDPSNRVVLGAERDRLGCRKAQLHWRWCDIDIRTVKRAQEIFKEDLAQAGLGQLQTELNEPQIRMPAGNNHHIGTTRMHVDPKQGVVDANCQVHSVSNLFLAGSSVFPTGGYANPTFTIIALAIRLADHVKKVMAPNLVTVHQSSRP